MQSTTTTNRHPTHDDNEQQQQQQTPMAGVYRYNVSCQACPLYINTLAMFCLRGRASVPMNYQKKKGKKIDIGEFVVALEHPYR